MKKRIINITAFVLALCFFMFPIYPINAYAYNTNLISMQDFIYGFNMYDALFNIGHEISTDDVEISKLSDILLVKKIYNGCEILSLLVSPNTYEVNSVHCTLSTLTPKSDQYVDDFMVLLMEVLLACGMKTDSISDAITKLGAEGSFSIGDNGQVIVDGIRISYEVTRTIGVSFVIDKA